MSQRTIAMIGAGQVNFGGGEGPWDHASRLEQIPGLRCVAVVDRNSEQAHAVLKRRQHELFSNCKVYTSVEAMLQECRPEAAWIGLPPWAHGAAAAAETIEIPLLTAGVDLFIEKPISNQRRAAHKQVAELIARQASLVSVGYMFRYHPAIERLQQFIADMPTPPMAFQARYGCAYTDIDKADWWDCRRTGGPLVEQATHFIDLARYLLGEVDHHSLVGHRLAATEPAAQLNRIPNTAVGQTLEADVPAAHRVPRASNVQWRFESGALGSLMHVVALHGKHYDTAIDIWGDGWRASLTDPYQNCRLELRQTDSSSCTVEDWPDSDPYLKENQLYISALCKRSDSLIRCTFTDALATHELAWLMQDCLQ